MVASHMVTHGKQPKVISNMVLAADLFSEALSFKY